MGLVSLQEETPERPPNCHMSESLQAKRRPCQEQASTRTWAAASTAVRKPTGTTAAPDVVPGYGTQAMVSAPAPAPAPQTETETKTPTENASTLQTQSLPGSPTSCCNRKCLLPAAVLLWGSHIPVPLHVS